MSKFSDLFGSINNLFQIGIGGTGARTLRFRNGSSGDLTWNPTASRVLTLPDATGTLATITQIPVTNTPIFWGTKEFADTHQSIPATSFTNNIALPNINVDSFTKWNATNRTYTIPATGNYLILSRLRLPDNVSPAMGWGQGVHTSQVDGAYFYWDVTRSGATNNRNIILNTRIAPFNINEVLNFFTYVDTASLAWVASLIIVRLS